MNIRLTFWHDEEGNSCQSFDEEINELTLIVKNAKPRFISGLVSFVYGIYGEDGETMLQVEFFESEGWKKLSVEEILDLYVNSSLVDPNKQPELTDSHYYLKDLGYHALFKDVDDEFLAGLKYYKENINPEASYYPALTAKDD